MVVSKFAYNPLLNLNFVEHLNWWFILTHEIHENWYPTNNKESTVTSVVYFKVGYIDLMNGEESFMFVSGCIICYYFCLVLYI